MSPPNKNRWRKRQKHVTQKANHKSVESHTVGYMDDKNVV